MKGIKNQSFRIAILLAVLGSMAILYCFGFYKQFDQKSIPQNADAIAVLDVKNIRNHFIFSFLKNPSRWKSKAGDSNKEMNFDFTRFGIETSDYFSFFHIKNQPINQWYVIATIESELKFDKSINETHFITTKLNNSFISYYAKTSDLLIIRFGNQILCSKNVSNNHQKEIQVAENVFLKHNYFDSQRIKKAIETPNAVTIWLQKNNLLQEDAFLNISLKEDEILAEGQLNWKPNTIRPTSFIENPNALLSLGFNFEMIQDQNIKRHSAQISKIIGFDLDSILANHPTKTELVFNEIIEKKDSAITYDYDDDFNPIKKVVVHTSREPSFEFTIQTDNSKKVFAYLKAKKAIDEHNVFVNFPLASTKAFIKNNSFILEANSTKANTLTHSLPKIAYLQMNLKKLQAKDWQFLINKNKAFSLLKPFKSLEISIDQKNSSENFRASLKQKKGEILFESR